MIDQRWAEIFPKVESDPGKDGAFLVRFLCGLRAERKSGECTDRLLTLVVKVSWCNDELVPVFIGPGDAVRGLGEADFKSRAVEEVKARFARDR